MMMRRIAIFGASLCLTLTFGCGTEDDDEMMTTEDAGMATPATGMDDEDQGPDIGGDCSCGEGESICDGDCPMGLTCAALSCTIRCDEDMPCPDGSTCTPISAQDFDENDTTNFGFSYCFES